MLNKRIIIMTVLILAVALQTGCFGKDSQKIPDNGKTTEQKTSDNSAIGQEDRKKAIMDEFSEIIEKDGQLTEIIGFINKNISLLSKEYASTMVIELEKAQKKKLPELEEMFYKDSVQNEISKVFGLEFDINKIDEVGNKQLKELLIQTRDSGYRVEMAEGMYFPVIDYELYKKYNSYVTADIKEFIDIMAMEWGKAPAKDAALVISWDEVLKRALNQEKFISQYPDSEKINDIKQLYKKYVSFVFYGTDNTPLFSYASKTMSEDAKSVYLKAVKEGGDSKLKGNLRMFLDILKKSNYKLTDEVEKLRESALENI